MAQAQGQGATGQEPGGLTDLGLLNVEMQRCIRNCLDCFAACEQTATYCLTKGGKHAAVDHIRLLLDCAESCRMSASLMSRKSIFHAQHCALCAEVCRTCAESCEKMGDDPQMKACAEVCRRCEESCRRMGGARA